MKLQRLKYSSADNRLKTYDFDFANGREAKSNRLEPLCFVGLNGSGKSKLIELLAEIFFTLDANHPQSQSSKSEQQAKSDFSLEYQLREGRKFQWVSVTAKKGSEPIIKVDNSDKALEKSEWHQVLPSNIIGYSSGHNETISPLFLSLRHNDLTAALKQLEVGDRGDVSQTRTLFLDRDTTKLLLLSLFLFDGDKNKLPNKESVSEFRQQVKELIRLEALLSFQLTIDLRRKGLLLSRRMTATLEKLKHVALMSNTSTIENGNLIKLDFFVDKLSRQAIKTRFNSPIEFFASLYELNSLNQLVKAGESPIFSVPDDELKIKLASPQAETTYYNLSDGEHQFIQIFGATVLFTDKDSLFLLDEPESHFNPKWRAKFVFLLDELLSEQQKSAEFLISTHSPYLVSACKKSNVVKFVRDENGIAFDRLEDQTYGASFDVLLDALFDMKGLVSEIAKKDLQAIVQSDKEQEEKLKMLNEDFGDSYEKRLLINMLKKGFLDAIPRSAD